MRMRRYSQKRNGQDDKLDAQTVNLKIRNHGSISQANLYNEANSENLNMEDPLSLSHYTQRHEYHHFRRRLFDFIVSCCHLFSETTMKQVITILGKQSSLLMPAFQIELLGSPQMATYMKSAS